MKSLKWSARVWDLLILLTGFASFIFIITLSSPKGNWSYIDILRNASAAIKGEFEKSDIAQDIVGFRAMMSSDAMYQNLGVSLKTLGIDWPIEHKSTHPPTAYILVAPVALFSWPVASSAWALLMIVLYVVSMYALGANPIRAIGLGFLLLLWPPAALSLGQLTPIWFLGLALASRTKKDSVFRGGLFIGLASLSKFLPAVMLVPFILKRRWLAFVGFAFVWVVVLSIVLMLTPSALTQYLVANISNDNSVNTILRYDNGAFLAVLYRLMGTPGMVLGILMLLILAVWNWQKLDEEGCWQYFSFLAVALLPIAWIYSLLPLVTRIKKDKNVLAISAFALTFIMPPFGTMSALIMLLVFLLFYLSFLPPLLSLQKNKNKI